MNGNDKYLAVARVLALTSGYSPMLRDVLFSRPDIVDREDIATDATISLGSQGVAFRRSLLWPAIAEAYANSLSTVVTTEGDEWAVKFERAARPPNVVLERNGQRLLVAQFALLSNDPAGRIEAFDTLAAKLQLPPAVIAEWQALLAARAPSDTEIMNLRVAMQNTPIGTADAIKEELAAGKLILNTLVPQSEDYYRQLVGDAGEADSLEAYLADCAQPFLSTLLAGGDRRGLSLAWLMCSQPLVSRLIASEWRSEVASLADGLEWLAKHGDPISRTASIEVGLQLLKDRPELADPVVKLVGSFIDAKAKDKAASFDLLSGLFLCVYGQMAAGRILPTWKPFARRLAALAHASMVHRHFIGAGDLAKLTLWLRGINEHDFTLQCLMDMREEPRWFPELASANQWKHELYGRVLTAAAVASEAVKSTPLKDRLLGQGKKSLIKEIELAAMFLPGPLEGGTNSANELSADAIAHIEGQLTGTVDTVAFSGIINAHLLYKMPDHLVQLATDAVERCHYQIPVGQAVPLDICLHALASLAAVSRNLKLQEAVHIALRVSRRLNKGQLSTEETFRAGLLACCAQAERAAWAEQVGSFMTELALQDLTVEEAQNLHSHLSFMCHSAPELWGAAGAALAGFELVIG